MEVVGHSSEDGLRDCCLLFCAVSTSWFKKRNLFWSVNQTEANFVVFHCLPMCRFLLTFIHQGFFFFTAAISTDLNKEGKLNTVFQLVT